MALSGRSARVLLLAVAFVLLAFGGTAMAGTVIVTTTNDTDSTTSNTCTNDGAAHDCSLRNATKLAGAGDTIRVPAGHYVLTRGELAPSNSFSIVGDGAKSTIIDANNASRVFEVEDETVFFQDLTITGGNTANESSGDGGGILTDFSGGAGLLRVAVTGNQARANGGGIANEVDSGGKALSIDHSEISHNTAGDGGGGGIYADGDGTGSPATPGAAVHFGVATVPNTTITDSTIANNDATFGGGIAAFPFSETNTEVVDLLNDTIAQNTAEESPPVPRAATANGFAGAGIQGTQTNVFTANTIFAQNTDPNNGNGSDNCSGASMFSQDYNLADDSTCQLNGAHDQVVTNAMLGSLADNGGQTRTMALLEGSPAIDGSDSNNCPTDDQRGVSRPQRAACDTGAFELQAVSADMALTKTASQPSVNVGQTVTFTLTSTNHGPNDATNTVVTDTLPNGVAFVSDNPSQGSCTGTTTITCHLGTVSVGAHATITIVARITNSGLFVNNANVTADPADPNSANNHASATVIGVNPAAPSCVDTRKWKFELHKWHKTRVIDAVVFINGKKAGHRKGHDLKSITIAPLPQQVFLVRIVSTQATGSKLISRRTYSGCIKSRPKTTAFHIHPHHHHHHHHA